MSSLCYRVSNALSTTAWPPMWQDAVRCAFHTIANVLFANTERLSYYVVVLPRVPRKATIQVHRRIRIEEDRALVDVEVVVFFVECSFIYGTKV